VTKRTLPSPEKFASCPYDGNILSYYEDQFEAVYVLLYPFLKPTTLSPERFCPETYPSKPEIISGCKKVSWQEVIELTSFNDISEVDIGLKTGIGGLRKELCNKSSVKEIDNLFENKSIIEPVEGDIPEILQNDLFGAIKSLGHNWLWVGDEHGMVRKLHWIDDLFDKNELLTHCNVFTHDHSLLLTTHWDSHFSFLCSSKQNIENILKKYEFEGFYCTANTEVYWSTCKI